MNQPPANTDSRGSQPAAAVFLNASLDMELIREEYTTPSCRRSLLGYEGAHPSSPNTSYYLKSTLRNLTPGESYSGNSERVSPLEGPFEQLVPLLAVSLRREHLLESITSSHSRMHAFTGKEPLNEAKKQLFMALNLSHSPLEFMVHLKETGFLLNTTYREVYDAVANRILLTSIETPEQAPDWLANVSGHISKHFKNFGFDNDDRLPPGKMEESLYARGNLGSYCHLESVDEKYLPLGRRLTRLEQLLNVKHTSNRRARKLCDRLTVDFLYRFTGLSGPATTLDMEALLLFDVHQAVSQMTDKVVGIEEGCNIDISDKPADVVLSPILNIIANTSVPADMRSEVLLLNMPHQCRLRHISKAFRKYVRGFIRHTDTASLFNLLQEEKGEMPHGDASVFLEHVEKVVQSPFADELLPPRGSFHSIIGKLSPAFVPLWTLDVWEQQKFQLFHGSFAAIALTKLDGALRYTLPSYINHPYLAERKRLNEVSRALSTPRRCLSRSITPASLRWSPTSPSPRNRTPLLRQERLSQM